MSNSNQFLATDVVSLSFISCLGPLDDTRLETTIVHKSIQARVVQLPYTRLPPHSFRCSVSNAASVDSFRNSLMATDLGSRPILLPWMGSSRCVAVHMREKLCCSSPGGSASHPRRVGCRPRIWDLIDGNQFWCSIFQQRAASERLSDRRHDGLE
jgi:hypothetical protein